MSIDIRHFTNGEISKWVVRNCGSSSVTVDVYNNREEIPKDIRKFATDERERNPILLGPGSSDFWGVQDIFYPNFQKCDFEQNVTSCIAEDCVYGADGKYKTCEFRIEKKERE